jgi:hypothetical protein
MSVLHDAVKLIDSAKNSIKKDLTEINKIDESLHNCDYYMTGIPTFEADFKIAKDIITSLKSFLEELETNTIERIVEDSEPQDDYYRCDVKINVDDEDRFMENFTGWNRFIQMLLANTSSTLGEAGIDSFWGTKRDGGFSLIN